MEKVELKRKQEAAGRLSLVRPVTVVVAVWTSNTARPSARWKRCAYVAVANQPFLWTAFFFFFEGRLRRCLAEEKQRRFGSGGVLFVKPVWRAVLLHFFIFCFFVIFCDGHTLHIIVGSQKKKFPYYYSYSIIAI